MTSHMSLFEKSPIIAAKVIYATSQLRLFIVEGNSSLNQKKLQAVTHAFMLNLTIQELACSVFGKGDPNANTQIKRIAESVVKIQEMVETHNDLTQAQIDTICALASDIAQKLHMV